MKWDYNRQQLASALKEVGVRRGDVVFSHNNVGFFGLPQGGATKDAIFDTVLGAFDDVLGPDGTLVVPAFTNSFCRGEPFDPDTSSASDMGMFCEMLRNHPEAHRSGDAIFSVTALGRLAEDLTRDCPAECFGEDSFWARLLRSNGIICNLNRDAFSTFVHYVERRLRVPYRYDKVFRGIFLRNDSKRPGAAIYYVKDLSVPDTWEHFEGFDRLARKQGLARSAKVGRGAVVAIRASDVLSLIETELNTNPWFLTKAGQTGRASRLVNPLNRHHSGHRITEDANMTEIVGALWPLNRDVVSDGSTDALSMLQSQLPLIVHEYESGSQHSGGWIVPEKWSCEEAYIETLSGRRFLSYADNPLHLVSYSVTFEGEVSKGVLSAHVHALDENPSVIPYRSCCYENAWGFCGSRHVLNDMLQEENFRVRIRSTFSRGVLKVGEVLVPGAGDETVILLTHLGHPRSANRGLSGIAVGVEVVRLLLKKRNLRHNYRLLIAPDKIGFNCFLSCNDSVMRTVKGALFLDFLGTDGPLVAQLSGQGTDVDSCVRHVVRHEDPQQCLEQSADFFGGNEPPFTRPQLRIAVTSLTRSVPVGDNSGGLASQEPCSEDFPSSLSVRSLADSRDCLLRIIDSLERLSSR